MSEDEAKNLAKNLQHEDEQDEIEAHRSGAMANDEGTSEGDDDVEGHMRRAGAKNL